MNDNVRTTELDECIIRCDRKIEVAPARRRGDVEIGPRRSGMGHDVGVCLREGGEDVVPEKPRRPSDSNSGYRWSDSSYRILKCSGRLC